MKLNNVMIGSEDPERLAAYYTKLFGEPVWNEGGYVGWQLGDAGITVFPHSEVKGQNDSPGRIMWNLETPDVRGEFEKLRGAGATVVREPYDPSDGESGDQEMLVCTFSDPDGNYFQLASPMP